MDNLECYAKLVEKAIFGTYIVKNNKFIHVNPKSIDLFGYSEDEILNKMSPLDIFAPEDKNMVAERISKRQAGDNRVYKYTARCMKKDGTIFTADVSSYSEKDENGNVVIYATYFDISDFVEADGELKQVYNNLEKSVEEQTSELRKSNEALEAEIAIRKQAEEEIKKQSDEIVNASTPIVKMWDGIILIPIIGTVDTRRAELFTRQLLEKASDRNCAIVIIDITGVPVIDTLTAQYFLDTVSSLNLIGVQAIITGIKPAIAQTMVSLGIEMGTLKTSLSAQKGLVLALDMLGIKISKLGETGRSVALND